MGKLVGGSLFLLLMLGACADNLMVRWGQEQQIYNAALTEIIRYRDPCVSGPKWPDGNLDHPLCFIDDNTMRLIVIARDNAREFLDRARIAAELGNEVKAEEYLAQVERALEDLLFYQLRVASQAREG